ncbi:hypothetical protein FHX37_2847 [Haloactinospora alba]|uniref:Uncharacterized protein n=1 Tax=Haloactinospora alba TaxID=405555 RepID=A0A543NLZ7_9ACTN|nr:hypothetical protein [Haloactinospora alba]TQN32861.1 hypothetical protein FHX37_2847 [Haloactinospora alba]
MAISVPTESYIEGEVHFSEEGYEEMVMEACEYLENTDCGLRVRGFGEDWPVDVGYDLSTVMEELPDLIESIRATGSGEIDFYAQGMERTLSFSTNGEEVEITCASTTSWRPDPRTEKMGTSELDRMLVSLAVNFGRSVEFISPPLSEREPFASWKNGVV